MRLENPPRADNWGRMNLKLNNERTPSIHSEPLLSSAEERRRTGRYIAILVGISLILLALYHAWVLRIPEVASLIVPALIMFLYVGWILYTASRDKRIKETRDLQAAMETDRRIGSSTDYASPECSGVVIHPNKQTLDPEQLFRTIPHGDELLPAGSINDARKSHYGVNCAYDYTSVVRLPNGTRYDLTLIKKDPAIFVKSYRKLKRSYSVC